MVKIRLRRMGAKKQPTYRFVVADSRSPRDGRFIEILGHYNPRTEPKTLVVDEAKAKEWIAKGAQPTPTVRRLLAERGVVERGPIPERKRAPKAPKAS
jgi:small subunit ribosomal protein S16